MLKTLMLRKRIDDKKKLLGEAREKQADIQKRESEIAGAINEAVTEEEKATVEKAVEDLDAEKAANEAEIENLEKEVGEMEQELTDIESRQNTTSATQEPEPAPVETRKAKKEINIMKRRFADFTHEERTAFVANESVKAFIENIRSFISAGKEKRAITNADYTIPTEVLDLIRANVEDYSKLVGKVNPQRVAGKARQTIMGLIPEAVWTEQCGKLNEIDLSFLQVEVDGFKVGGFVAVCNALVEDSDIDLLGEIVNAIGQAIAYALDKAILYGTGVKMPTGIFKAIDADAAIKATNIKKHAASVTGIDLFKNIMKDTKAINKKYGKAGLTWVMSNNTYADLQVEAMGVNASGAIVSGMNQTMPVIGGEVITLEFIPDGTIFVGCFDNYLLAERAGASIKQSTEYRFVEDQTVVKGTSRYDGKPVIVNAFEIIGIGGANPAVGDVTFAPDTANTPAS